MSDLDLNSLVSLLGQSVGAAEARSGIVTVPPPPQATPSKFGGRYITVFVDASHCPDTKAFGWGGWIKHGDPATTILAHGSGVGVANSSEAEVLGILEALLLVEKLPFVDKMINVQCDCTGALADPRVIVALGKFRLAGAAAAYTKWVKGHAGKGQPRSAVNTGCDRVAKREMRRVREQILQDRLNT